MNSLRKITVLSVCLILICGRIHAADAWSDGPAAVDRPGAQQSLKSETHFGETLLNRSAARLIGLPPAGTAARSSATVTVAARNSRAGVMADYRCDGISDEIKIQAAIDAVASLPQGGVVKLLEGNFSCSGKIDMKSHVALEGMGQDFTKITSSGSGNGTARGISIEVPIGQIWSGILISKFHLAMRTNESSSAILIGVANGTLNHFTLADCHLEPAESGSGLWVGSENAPGSDWKIIDNLIETKGSRVYGISIWHPISYLWIERNHVHMGHPNSLNGIAVYGGSHHVFVCNNLVTGTPGHSSIALSTGYDGIIAGNNVEAPNQPDEYGIETEFKLGHTLAQDTAANHVIVANNRINRKGDKGTGGVVVRIDGPQSTPKPDHVLIIGNIIQNVITGIKFEEGTQVCAYGNIFDGVTTRIGIDPDVTTLPFLAMTGIEATTQTLHGPLTMKSVPAAPGSSADADEGQIYFKGNQFVVQWNDRGTIKYRSMDLTTTNSVWTYSTTPP